MWCQSGECEKRSYLLYSSLTIDITLVISQRQYDESTNLPDAVDDSVGLVLLLRYVSVLNGSFA